ncbi:MAG: chaperone NapD [Nitrospirota bacterium]
MNVSSIVVKTIPEHIDSVISNIKAIDFCEVHFSNKEGKIVVTIEGESIENQMEIMKCVQALPNVANANLVYSYCEEELADSLEKIQK